MAADPQREPLEDDEQEMDAMDPKSLRPKMVTSLIFPKGFEYLEQQLVDRALERLNDLQAEMGGTYVETADGQFVDGWMRERQLNQAQYDNDWEWRKALGGVFEFSNFSLNLSKRYARLMSAKTSDDLVGSDPFFSCMPTQRGDPRLSAADAELSKEAEWYLQEKISASNLKRRIKSAQKSALIRNECVVKLNFEAQDTHFVGPGTVAIGPWTYTTPQGDVTTLPGEPVLTPKGEYIYQRDDIFPDPTTEGIYRLEKEPGVSFRAPFQFQYFDELDQVLHGAEGISLRELDYRDFYCPLNVPTIHEADINIHTFDEQLERLRATYGGFAVSEAWVRSEYQSGEKQPKLEKKEEPTNTKLLRIVNCADVYMRVNIWEGTPFDRGVESEVWMIIDRTTKRAIWYDYLGNHMERRPFEVIPGVETVQNRWYGVGVFEMLAHKQGYVDAQFNRVNWKSMKTSSLRFIMKNAVEEWKAGEDPIFGDDTIYRVTDQRYDATNPPFFEVHAKDLDPEAMELIKLMIQAGSTEVGIVGPDDGALSGLDATDTATGIKSLERTGNLLMKFTETDHAEAIVMILEQAVEMILEHMDQDELTFRRDTGQLIELNREEIRRLRSRVKLLLTRSRSTDTIENARMVIQLLREYHEALNPREQYYCREEYIRQLKALEVPDAEQKLPEVTPDDVAAWQQAQANAATMIPKTSIATKYPDLLRSEQVQVLKKENIVPGSDAELAQKLNTEAKQEGEIAGAKAKEEAKFEPKNEPGSKPKSSGGTSSGKNK